MGCTFDFLEKGVFLKHTKEQPACIVGCHFGYPFPSIPRYPPLLSVKFKQCECRRQARLASAAAEQQNVIQIEIQIEIQNVEQIRPGVVRATKQGKGTQQLAEHI